MRQALDRVGEGRDERVARILAGERGGNRDARRQERRQVLGRVDRGVDFAGEQRGVDFLGEQAFAAGLGERPVLDPVAARADGSKRDPRDLPAVRRPPEGGAPRSPAPAPRASRECRG